MLNLSIRALVAFLIIQVSLQAGGEANEVVVVYNRRGGSQSERIAKHYADRRGVPAQQIFGLSLPETENMTRGEYRAQLEKPLLHELESHGLMTFMEERVPTLDGKPDEVVHRPLEARIRYVVLCYGVPLRIIRDATLIEPQMDKLTPALHRNEASVDSELATLPQSRYRFSLYGPSANRLFGVTNASLLNAANGLLMVARLDGPTPEIARGLVDKAMQAEQDGLWGRAYFDVRGIQEGSYKIGDDWFRAAYQITKRQGFETALDEKPETFPVSFPMPQIALYGGWYDGTVSGPFTLPKVEFMPGAIAYHLHSYSASTLRSDSQAWVGPLLAKGVTATMGCVDEPYLEGTPNMEIFFARLLLSRFSFGEAAYASQVALSWQTTVVGDPLYRPFGRHPKEQHEDLERRHSPLIEWSHLRVVNLNLVTGTSVGEVISYLEEQPITRKSAVLEEKLGNLYLGLGKTTDAVREFEKALALSPTPQQRLEIQLQLASALSLLERDAQALAVYQRILRDNPHYSEILSFHQRILALARKLNDSGLTQKTVREIERLSPPTPPGAPAPATPAPSK